MGNGATKLFIAVSPMQAGIASSKFAEFLEKMKLGFENPKFVRILEMFGHGTGPPQVLWLGRRPLHAALKDRTLQLGNSRVKKLDKT